MWWDGDGDRGDLAADRLLPPKDDRRGGRQPGSAFTAASGAGRAVRRVQQRHPPARFPTAQFWKLELGCRLFTSRDTCGGGPIDSPAAWRILNAQLRVNECPAAPRRTREKCDAPLADESVLEQQVYVASRGYAGTTRAGSATGVRVLRTHACPLRWPMSSHRRPLAIPEVHRDHPSYWRQWGRHQVRRRGPPHASVLREAKCEIE